MVIGFRMVGLLRTTESIPEHNIVNISYLQMSSLATIIAWLESIRSSPGPGDAGR